MMYFCVFVVIGTLATLTSASDGLRSVFGEFESVKNNDGVAQCVTLPSPKTSVSTRSRLDCMRACISDGCLCAQGANYYVNDGTCELYSKPPNSLEKVPNCVYYQVLV